MIVYLQIEFYKYLPSFVSKGHQGIGQVGQKITRFLSKPGD